MLRGVPKLVVEVTDHLQEPPPCSAPGCGHVHELQCALMAIASGGLRRVGNVRRSAPYGWPGVEILDEAFHERAGLWDELQTTIGRLSRSASSSGSAGKASERPMPYHERASAVAHRMRNELSTWARVILEERSGLQSPADHPPVIARWLADRLASGFVRLEMANGIRAVVRDAERVIDQAPDRIFAGRCETPLTQEGIAAVAKDPQAEVPRCMADIYAERTPAEPAGKDADDAETAQGFVRCRACGAVHDVAYRQRWLAEHLSGSLVTAGESAPYLSWLTGKEIKVDTIHKWRRTRGIEAEDDRAGRPLYRFRDLLALAREVRTRTSRR